MVSFNIKKEERTMRGYKLLYGLILSAILIMGCGSQEAMISSLKISVYPEETPVDVDVAVWKDTNNDKICDAYSVKSTVVDINLEVTPVSTNLVDPESTLVIVDEVNIDYFPISSTVPNETTPPPLSSISHKLGVSITGQTSSVTIPIEIFSQSQKISKPISDLRYGEPRMGHIYAYDVRITFIVKSPYTGETGKVTTYIPVEVAEFVSDQENCSFP